MTKDSDLPDIVYRLNDRDEICFVNERYDDFAVANLGAAMTSAKVLNRSLWAFVTDPNTQQLYREALRKVRSGTAVRFTFRCDSPSCRRLLAMEITCADDLLIEFRVRTLKEESRPSQPLLEPNMPRSNDVLRMCGWCKKVHVGDAWLEVEEAAARLRLFELPLLPNLSHGICEECYKTMFAATTGV